ncbi:MAG: hypothetical protein R3C10_06900 [Pirellulales bacterium]
MHVSLDDYGVDLTVQHRLGRFEHREARVIGAPLVSAPTGHVGVTVPAGDQVEFVRVRGDLPRHPHRVRMMHAQHAES